MIDKENTKINYKRKNKAIKLRKGNLIFVIEINKMKEIILNKNEKKIKIEEINYLKKWEEMMLLEIK